MTTLHRQPRLLTIEGGEAFGGDAAQVDRFADLGVRMAALVWNNENGVLVMKVAENSPLSLTNVKPGDYILAIDGKKISSVKEMRDILDGHQPGDRISLTYSHNGRETNTDVLLSSAPGNNS